MFKCYGRYVTSVTELAFVISTLKKKVQVKVISFMYLFY